MVYIYLGLISIFTFLVSNYAHFLTIGIGFNQLWNSHIFARHRTDEQLRQLDITGATIVRVLPP